MSNRLPLVAGLLLLVMPAAARAHGPWGFIDGVAANPTLVRGNAPVQVARLGTGFYRLTFPYAVDHFLATSQSIGPGGDVTPTLVSVAADDTDPRVIRVIVYGVTNGSRPRTTHLVPVNASFSFEYRR